MVSSPAVPLIVSPLTVPLISIENPHELAYAQAVWRREAT
jgi:hypothetical protein